MLAKKQRHISYEYKKWKGDNVCYHESLPALNNFTSQIWLIEEFMRLSFKVNERKILYGEAQKCENGGERGVNIDDERVVVANADAIIYPRAMMVPSLTTFVTYVAVFGTWRFHNLASWTQLAWLHKLKQFQKVNVFMWLNVAWTWTNSYGQHE